MSNQTAPAPHKPDNLLGICHALGETLGFNPLFLRLALLVGVMVNAEIALSAYAVGGFAVATAHVATRLAGRASRKTAGELVTTEA